MRDDPLRDAAELAGLTDEPLPCAVCGTTAELPTGDCKKCSEEEWRDDEAAQRLIDAIDPPSRWSRLRRFVRKHFPRRTLDEEL